MEREDRVTGCFKEGLAVQESRSYLRGQNQGNGAEGNGVSTGPGMLELDRIEPGSQNRVRHKNLLGGS